MLVDLIPVGTSGSADDCDCDDCNDDCGCDDEYGECDDCNHGGGCGCGDCDDDAEDAAKVGTGGNAPVNDSIGRVE